MEMTNEQILNDIETLKALITNHTATINKFLFMADECDSFDKYTILNIDVIVGSNTGDAIHNAVIDSLNTDISDWKYELRIMEEMLSKKRMTDLEYQDAMYEFCPRCKSDNISKGSLNESGGDFIQRFCSCGHCGDQWEERWQYDTIISH